MIRVRPFMLVSASLCLAGCPTKTKYDMLPSVRITSPTIDATYTHGTVHVTAAIDPPLDLPIELRRDGAAFTTLVPPAYEYSWDTTKSVEASYVLTAEVAFSNDTARSGPVTIVVDRTPPTLSRSPSPGAGDVVLRAPIQVAFSEPIVLSRAAEATFTLSNNGAIVPTSVTLDSRGQTATIGIADPSALPLPTTLAATIMGPIMDRAGNRADLPSSDWFWDVPPFIKLPPSPVDPNISPATRLPAFAVGPDSKPVFATASSTTTGGSLSWQVQVSQYDGTTWTPLGPPSDDIDSASRGVALAIGGEQPFVAWRPSGRDPVEIDVASWNGVAWKAHPSIALASTGASSILTPILRIGRDEEPVILWSTGDRTFLARRTQIGWARDFGTIPITSVLPFDGNHFDMILDDGDNPIVSWINPTGTGHVSMWNGVAWAAAPDALSVSDPFLALDSGRRPMQVVTGGTGALLVQRLAVENEWQLLPVAAVPPQAKHTKIAAGPAGLPVVAYFDAQTKSVGMARWTGDRWDTRAFTFGPNSIDEAPQLAVDRNGTAWIGWRDASNQFNLWVANF
jgi:hypothetical protein